MEFGLFKKEWLNEMVTNNGDSVLNLTFENPVLLVFLRHFGCIFCKEALVDISKNRSKIETGGLKIVFVHMTDVETAEKNCAETSNKNVTECTLKKEAQLALWICLGTICRIGELLKTEWKHINFEQRTWFIPAANTKGEQGRKSDQIIYISDFTIDKFEQLHAITGASKWVFPGRITNSHVDIKTVSKQVGDRQVKFKSRTRKLKNRVEDNSLVLGNEDWTPHDLRRTGATMMQKLKISREVINLCQNHVIGSKVDRVYLLDDYADDKREAWGKLGDRIEAILSSSSIVSMKVA